MIKLIKQYGGSCAVFISLSTTVIAADIYRAQNPDGSYRYATQALHAGFTLYLLSDTHINGLAPVTHSIQKAQRLTALEPLIQRYANKHEVDIHLVRAVIDVESNFHTQAVSPKGAVGAMQLMPATASRYGVVKRKDPSQNIEAGVRYLKDLLAIHNGNVALALASYNAGEGAVAKYGKRVPPYKETMLYVPAVLTKMQAAKSQIQQEAINH